MNNIIEKFIDSKDIKLSSKNVYIRNLKKLYSILNYDQEKNILLELQNPKEIFKKINEYKNDNGKELSDSGKKGIISLCLILSYSFKPNNEDLFKKIYNEYLEELKKYNKSIDQKYSEKEKKNMKGITIKDLKKVSSLWGRKYKKSKNKLDLFLYLISTMYSNLKYPRRNIYITVKIISDISENDGKNNFLLLSENRNRFIFNDTKNSSKYELKIAKNSVFLRVLSIYLRNRQNQSSDYLLLSPYTGKRLNSSQLTKFVQLAYKPLGEKIGSSTIRKIFITDKLKNSVPLKKRTEWSKGMGNSTNTQSLYYEKH